jgi:hypothetical protein
MKKIFAALIVTITMLFFAKVVMAKGPDLKPGKWEFTTTATMPMMAEAKVTTQTECITLEEAESDPLAAVIEEGTCKVLNKKESGNTLEFEIECEGEMGMNMTGKGHFTANGTTASGKMEMTMNMPQNIPQMGGQSMKMIQEWKGKRIGDCD